MPLEQYQLSAVTSLYPFKKKHVTIISICPSVYLKASNISKLKRSDICAPWRPSLHPDLELPPVRRCPKGPQTVSLTLLHSLKSNYLSSQDTQPDPKPKCLAPISKLSARGCALEMLPVSLSFPFYFFPPVDPFFCEMIWYQSASLRQYQFRDSKISACTVTTLKKTDFAFLFICIRCMLGAR